MKGDDYQRKWVQTVGNKVNRKTAAGKDEPFLWLKVFGLIGWSVVVPLLLGIALGMWIDKTLHPKIPFTLTLLFAGLILGCFNAWNSLKGFMKK